MARPVLDEDGEILGIVSATQSSTVHEETVVGFGLCGVDAVVIWDQFDCLIESFDVAKGLHKEISGTWRQTMSYT